MRMNLCTEGRDGNALLAPFMRANQAQQLAQRCQVRTIAGAIGFGAGLADIRCAWQGNGMLRGERQQQHAEYAGPLRLRHAKLVKRVRKSHRRFAGGFT